MKTKGILSFIFILSLPILLQAQDIMHQETVARKLLHHLLDKEVDQMIELLSDDFLKQVPREQLEEITNNLEAQLGKFSHVSRVLHETSDGFHTVILVCRFGERDLGMRVVMDQKDKVAGFFITMAPPDRFTPPPAWADSSKFTEIPIEVDCGDIILPGILTMPVSENKVPIVVLVHGSGAHDMDESLGPNKIFRDIAWGLSTHGIAVLRYEKRNFRNHFTLLEKDSFTVWDEAGQDAVHAVNMASQLQGVDPSQVFLLGHSLGGMIAPRIAKAAPELNGIISLAGSPRQLYEIIPGQLEYLMNIRGDTTEASKQQLKEAREVAASLSKKRNNPTAVYDKELLGMPPAYLADMNRHDTGKIAESLPQRILILHGGRDYQVTIDDYNAWKEALKNHPNTTFKLYPELNHLFFAGEGDSNPGEYLKESNVSEMVITDIVDWVFSK